MCIELLTQTQKNNNLFFRLIEYIRQWKGAFYSDTQYKKIRLEISISWLQGVGCLFCAQFILHLKCDNIKLLSIHKSGISYSYLVGMGQSGKFSLKSQAKQSPVWLNG